MTLVMNAARTAPPGQAPFRPEPLDVGAFRRNGALDARGLAAAITELSAGDPVAEAGLTKAASGQLSPFERGALARAQDQARATERLIAKPAVSRAHDPAAIDSARPAVALDGVTGMAFPTMDDAAKAAGPGLMRLQEETGTEWGLIFERQGEAIVPSAAVTGTLANPMGEDDAVELNGLLDLATDPVGDMHTHPGDKSLTDENIYGHYEGRPVKRTTRDKLSNESKIKNYIGQDGTTYTSYVGRRLADGKGELDKAVGYFEPIPNPAPGGATTDHKFDPVPLFHPFDF